MTTDQSSVITDFTVSYQGSALDAHTMRARDLGPALTGLSDAMDRANEILNGPRATVQLEVQAPERGSFEIILILEQLLSQAGDALSGDFVTSAANMKTLIFGGGGVSLIGLIKWLRGRQPTRSAPDPDGKITLEIDRLRLSVPQDVLRLADDRRLRERLESAVRPVLRDGIDRVVFRDNSGELDTIEKQEAAYFGNVESDEGADTTETVLPRQWLKPLMPNFNKNGKWKMSDGEKNRWYSIKDAEFIRDVERGRLRFGSGDALVCEVVLVQSLDADGTLHLDHEIRTVIEHIPPTDQRRIPGIDDSDPSDAP